jgi:hypothetical protein
VPAAPRRLRPRDGCCRRTRGSPRPAVITSSTMTTRPGELRRRRSSPPFAVVLGFLAVERRTARCARELLARAIAVAADERNALIGRSEQHVVLDTRGVQCVGVTVTEFSLRCAVVKEPGIEKRGTFAARFERVAAEAEGGARECELDQNLRWWGCMSLSYRGASHHPERERHTFRCRQGRFRVVARAGRRRRVSARDQSAGAATRRSRCRPARLPPLFLQTPSVPAIRELRSIAVANRPR